MKQKKSNYFLAILCLIIFYSCNTGNDAGMIKVDVSKFALNCDKAIIRMWGYVPLGDSITIIDTINLKKGKFIYPYNIKEPKNLEIEILKKNHLFTKLYFINKENNKNCSNILFVKNENIIIDSNSKSSGFIIGSNSEKLKVEYYGSNESDIFFSIVSKKITPKEVILNSNSFAVLYTLFWQKEKLSIEELTQLLSLFSDEIKSSSPYKKLKTYLNKKIALSKNGYSTHFNWSDINGKAYDFKMILNKKKYVLLVFWASWCGPCRAEIPNLKEFNNKYSSYVSIASLSIDDDYKSWKKAVVKEKMPWLNLSGLPKSKSAIKEEYNISSVPNLILLDNNGKILMNSINELSLIQKYLDSH